MDVREKLIDANELLNSIRDDYNINGENFARIRRHIEAATAVDAVEVVHGRWIFGKDLPYSWGQIPKNKYHLYCSECLEQAFNRSEDNDPDFDVDTTYCHNCGADMRGSNDE